MNAIEMFKLRHADKPNRRQSLIVSTRDIMEDKFPDDPSYRDDIQVIGRNDINVRANNYRKQGFLMPEMDIQATLDNEFFLGDLLHMTKDDTFWLVTSRYEFHETFMRGVIVQCNHIIRFQLPNEYDIHEYYCVVERPYSKNLSTGQIVQVSNKEFRCRTQLTPITKRMFLKQRLGLGIGYDDTGEARLDTYTIDSKDILSNSLFTEEGFLILNLTEDQSQFHNDNIELMIADYRKPPEPDPIQPKKCIIKSYDENFIVRIGGGERIYYCDLLDEDGEIIEDTSPYTFDWVYNLNEVQTEFLDIVVDNNTLHVRCKYPTSNKLESELLNSTFDINCSVTDFIPDDATIKIVSLI